MPFKMPKGFRAPAVKKGKGIKKTSMTLKDAAATAKALDKLDSDNQGEMVYREGKGGKDPLKGSKSYGR